MMVTADPEGQMEAFQRFVAVERELLALLQAKLEAEEKLLRRSFLYTGFRESLFSATCE